MWRRIFRWLASILLAGALTCPVSAQEPPPGEKDKTERRPPAFEYALSIVGVMLVLVIICMPTRKR